MLVMVNHPKVLDEFHTRALPIIITHRLIIKSSPSFSYSLVHIHVCVYACVYVCVLQEHSPATILS